MWEFRLRKGNARLKLDTSRTEKRTHFSVLLGREVFLRRDKISSGTVDIA